MTDRSTTPITTSLVSDGPLRPVPRTSTRRPATTRRAKPVPTQPGDPACWGWPPFNFGRELDPDKAMRAFYAWHKGRCGICGQVPGRLVVDHDHNSALVRGLCCDSCNTREGVEKAPQNVFARWRAVPSAALLGIEVVYANPTTGLSEPMPFKVTGPAYLPEWAPAHHQWPPASVRGPQPVLKESTPLAPRPAAPEDGSDEWPVRVREYVALGLRARPHGDVVCHIGNITRVTKFGVQIDVGTYGEDDEYTPELHTVPWDAIAEIVHAPGGLKGPGAIWDFNLRWRLGEKGYAILMQRRDRRRAERALYERGKTVPGYL